MQQQERQTPATNAGPVLPVYASQPYQTTPVIGLHRYRQSTIIGALLMIAGSLSIVSSCVEIAILFKRLSYWSVGLTGDNIFCGIMIIIAGGFGVGAGRRKSRCMIITFLVFAIIGAMFAGGQAIRSSFIAYDVHNSQGSLVNMPREVYQEPSVFIYEVLLAVLGVCEFALCLWGSIVCCASGGCCGSQPVVYAMVPAGDPVATAQHPADLQPVIYPTPPPQYPGYDSK